MTDILYSEQSEIRITGPLRPVVQQIRTCCGYRWAGCGKGSAPRLAGSRVCLPKHSATYFFPPLFLRQQISVCL